jgi:arylformamidase
MPYDRSELDTQYNLRLRHPDFQGFFDQNEAESERVRRSYACMLDVPYGGKPGERLDFFPASKPGSAVHLFIHGGYWQMLDKRSHSFVAEPFIQAGCAVVVINYTLAPLAHMDEIVRQSRAAVAWAFHHARDFNGDPSRLYLSGHSAGAHLTAMMMVTDWATDWGFPHAPIKGGCAISGIFDLEPIRLCYLNQALDMDREVARRNSPIHHMKALSRPLIVAVGALETREFLSQATGFAAAGAADGDCLCEHMVLHGLHHYSILQELGKTESELTQAVFRQMALA